MPVQQEDYRDVAELEARLGHRFTDRHVLLRALTHSSADSFGHGYQRLEFLGDRILGLAVADMLFREFPDEPEGALSRRLHALVCRDRLADVAQDIELGPHIRIGRDSAGGMARQNPAILADALEAVIAALYLDGGMAAAKSFVETAWAARMHEAATPPKDAKSALQEWAMARGLPLPEYRVMNRRGPDHAPCFTVQAEVAGVPPKQAERETKRAAEQAAAAALLARITTGE